METHFPACYFIIQLNLSLFLRFCFWLRVQSEFWKGLKSASGMNEDLSPSYFQIHIWFKNKDSNISDLRVFSEGFSNHMMRIRLAWTPCLELSAMRERRRQWFYNIKPCSPLFETTVQNQKKREERFGHYRPSILCKNCEIMTVRPRSTRHATCVAAHNKMWQLCAQLRLLLSQGTRIAASDPSLSCGQLPTWKRKMHH